MLKRPLNVRFPDAVHEERKITTIRDKPWPVGKPIMLYCWTGAAYRSKQADVAAVIVESVCPIQITRLSSGAMIYEYSTGGDERLVCLWACEGFEDHPDMDAWFREVIKPGQVVTKHLMRFRLATSKDLA